MIKGIEGLLAMGILYALTDDDYGFFQVTANGTGDFKKNYELQETGWRPYTISFGDKWQFDYRVTPLAIPLSIIGYLRDAQKYQGEKDLGDKLSIIAFGAFRFMFDMTFLRGVSELFNTFSNENPGSASNFFERTSKYVQRTGKHFLIPNAVTQVSRSIQEVQEMPMKKAKGVLGEIIRDLPYLRDSLDNMYNVLGEPVIPDQLSRIKIFKGKHRGIRDAKSLEIWNIITDNQAWIGVPSRVTLKPDRSPMTDEEYDKFALKAGQLTKKALIKNLGRLKATKDKQKVRDMIQTIKTNARRQARIDVFGAEPLFKDLDLGTIF
jgi:hypothetical protein